MNTGGSAATVARSMRELAPTDGGDFNRDPQPVPPAALVEAEMLGLVAALRGHCQELLAQGVQARFHDENVPRSLPQDVELCLFRIVQEGLNNVVKHSGAREAHVTLLATEMCSCSA